LHDLRPLPIAALAAALFIGCLIGCGGGGFGDPPAKPLTNEYGDGIHISSVLGGFYGPATTWEQPNNVNSTGCQYPISTDVFVTGATVTAVDTHDETADGAVGTVYVQDTVNNVPLFAATSLFSPSFSPPDLRLAPGDVVDVAGSYEEFSGPSTGRFPGCVTLPQIAGTVSFRFDGAEPTPREITVADLGTYDSARQYLGMLVKVKDLTIADDGVAKSGRYNANFTAGSSTAAISDELWDVGGEHPLHANDHFTSVTGIITYFYSFHLAPRSAADFEP
jgi:hypothetical protein